MRGLPQHQLAARCTVLGRPMANTALSRTERAHRRCDVDDLVALRHAYASVLLDTGESTKALSEYLGHSDPGFTLRTYAHLLPSSETRTRKAIDDAFTEYGDPGPEAQGTSAPPPKPMCPQCALAA